MNDQLNNPFFASRYSEIKFFTALTVILSLLLIVSAIFGWRVERGDNSVPSKTAYTSFLEVNLQAEAIYVYDIRTKTVLFAKNENVRLPLASLTKIMSALVAEDLSPLYNTVTITSEALQADGDNGLYKDEKWLLQDLLDFSLLTSSNDGMRAIALSLGALSRAGTTSEQIINDFVGKMNLKAGELGLKNTYFWNETGLDESEIKGGAYGTARDVSALLEYILTHHSDLFSATRETTLAIESLDRKAHLVTNTDSLAGEIPGLLASKTGFTNTAGGNLTIVFDPELGRPIIITVLGSTEKGRFEDMRTLVNAVMAYINEN